MSTRLTPDTYYHCVITAGDTDRVLHSTQFPLSSVLRCALWATKQGSVGYDLEDTELFMQTGYGYAFDASSSDKVVLVSCYAIDSNSL